MKFSNGCWMVKEGFEVNSPQEVYDVKHDSEKTRLYAPFTKIRHAGQTLDGGMMTVTLSSPLEGVIRIQAVHHAGGGVKKPQFAVNESRPAMDVREADDSLSFYSGGAAVKVNKTDWKMTFMHNGKTITSSEPDSLSFIRGENGMTYMREQLSLDVGELIYGLGERFTPFVKNGQTVDIWNEDGGTGSEQAYKNIPFYLSNKGYGVFVNHAENVSFEVGSEKVSNVQFSVEGQELDYYLISGPGIKDVLNNYTSLTGKPPLVPSWSLGLWLSTSFLTDYDEATVTGFVDEMIERDIPLDVFHFDCLWMKEFEWCNFQWDERKFPEPEAMLKRLKAKGLKISVWINPYIAQKSPLFAEGAEKGYFIKRSDGSVWQWDKWQPGLAVVDFTNPDARDWYRKHLKKLLDMGVDSFKTDFGERIPTDVVYDDGSDSRKMHNYYAYLYNKVVFELLEQHKGKHEAVVFARSATAGGQQFPVHWGGDSLSSYSSMAETLRGGLSLGLCGFGYWSHDIGGFETGTTPDLYKRWTQFGLLSSHSRYHGSGEYKVPWFYDEEAVDVTRKFTKLKHSLMPYLYSYVVEAAEKGLPMMRPMVLEFPEDQTTHVLDRQYMIGENLLVAPVFNETGNVTYYLPEGTWTNVLTDRIAEGGRWHTELHDYMTLPLMIKENTILAMSDETFPADNNLDSHLTFHIFQLAEGKGTESIVYNEHNKQQATIYAVKSEDTITIEPSGLQAPYRVCLRQIQDVRSVSHGEKTAVDNGTVISVKNYQAPLIIHV